MRKLKEEVTQVFRQFAWHLAGKLASKPAAPKGKR
jgi:hypothetical protein